MDILAPVSSIMTTNLLTVNPKDNLKVVKEIFDGNRIHHLPVVRHKKIVGLISKTDLLYFLKGANPEKEKVRNEKLLDKFVAEDIMTKGLAKLESDDRINVALEVFKENLFHAIPVVDGEELKGIVTTYDIIKALSEDKVQII
ncbi:MAG: CBS domain-containing protein [Saprospiraceae bacterium]|nr:CBS domain-containing protein [Saprospiraceae bacterium]